MDQVKNLIQITGSEEDRGKLRMEPCLQEQM